MDDELRGGLRNALERGQSLNDAAQSFIRAGYNPADVKAAADSLMQGAISTIETKPSISIPVSQAPSLPSLPPSTEEKMPKPLPSETPITGPQPSGMSAGKIILIIVLVLVLATLLGSIAFFLIFPDKAKQLLSIFGL